MHISQITTVKGRKNDLLSNLPRWLDTPINQIILVDFACPEHTGKAVLDSKYGSDARVTVLIVDPEIAGPFYNHGFARNIGASIAKNDLLFFLDSDCRYNSDLLEFAEEKREDFGFAHRMVITPCELSTTGHGISEFMLKRGIPDKHQVAGQVIISNSIFYNINGFSEEHNLWGMETYDLLIRSEQSGVQFYSVADKLNLNWVYHRDHSDELIDRYLPMNFETQEDKEKAFLRSFWFYFRRRLRTFRAQPGRRFGIDEPTRKITMFVGGQFKLFRPGD